MRGSTSSAHPISRPKLGQAQTNAMVLFQRLAQIFSRLQEGLLGGFFGAARLTEMLGGCRRKLFGVGFRKSIKVQKPVLIPCLVGCALLAASAQDVNAEGRQLAPRLQAFAMQSKMDILYLTFPRVCFQNLDFRNQRVELGAAILAVSPPKSKACEKDSAQKSPSQLCGLKSACFASQWWWSHPVCEFVRCFIVGGMGGLSALFFIKKSSWWRHDPAPKNSEGVPQKGYEKNQEGKDRSTNEVI